MIAYNKELLDNTLLVEEAEHLQQGSFINQQQLDFIGSRLPGYNKHSNAFARIGLFLLGCVLYLASCSFLAVVILPWKNGGSYTSMFFIDALAGFLALELLLIRKLKYYGHGMDDAFLICAQLNMLLFVGFLTGNTERLTPVYVSAFLLGIVCFLRYADSFSALLACLGLSAVVANFCLHAGTTGRMLLPFIFMFLAAVIYACYAFLKKNQQNNYYSKSLEMCFAYSSLLFYVSGNYLVVREAGEMLLGSSVKPGEDIALAPVFYALTLLTPLAYIYFALKKKNRLLLWIGLVTIAFSVFSIRYYYHVIPTELALIAGGLVLFSLAWLTLRKLKGRTTGLTAEHDGSSASNELLGVEAIWLIEQHGLHPGATLNTHTGAEPGGGEFGGAGSAGKF